MVPLLPELQALLGDQAMIVRFEAAQAIVLEALINLAGALRDVGDFHALSAVVQGLNATPVARLRALAAATRSPACSRSSSPLCTTG